ncbi:MAG: ribosomal-processing cysteine protease Prp [bacterium]|nr:ribosomal-processing cysteine protease Prp [bacterium]
MIKVKVESKDRKHIDLIKIHGHAMYDDFGKDIVCSSVSSIVTTTVNGIYELNKKYLQVEMIPDGMIISITKEDQVCDKLINNMLTLLSELADNYPENITVK